MVDRNEHPERDAKADYKDTRDRDAKDHYSSRDYAGRDYHSSRDYGKESARAGSNQENKIYVGGLHYAATKEDIASVFSRAGRVVHVSLVVDQETQRSKGYAFVTFADEDAYSYAINKMDGVSIMGRNVVVNKALNAEEKAQAERERGRDREPRYVPRPQHAEKPHFDKPPGPKSKGFRVTITGLPDSYTWRELKDFLRNTTQAQPTYANVDRPGLGIGEWATSAERNNAVRVLDGMTLEGGRIRCEPLEEDRSGLDDYGRGGSHSRPERDPGYSRDERGRGGGGGGSYDDRYYNSRPYDGEGGGPRGGSYDDRYPEKYSGRGEGAGRAAPYDGPSRYESGGAGPRYDAPAGSGGRYEGGGYGPRSEPRDAPREGGRDPGYAPRDPGYRDGGRDPGSYGPRNGGGGGGYGAGGGGYGGGGRDYPAGGGRGGAPYDAPYPDKYASRSGDYGREGDYPPEGGARASRYDDSEYDVPPRREPSYGPPPRDAYGGGREPGYPPRERPYPESRGGPAGSGGREPAYERGSAGYERGSGGAGGGGGGGGGYERGGYDRGGEHYGYEREAGGGYKGGAGGGYAGSGRPPAGSGPPPSGRSGAYPPERYEGTGRGGPDRNYAGARGSGYERSAPY